MRTHFLLCLSCLMAFAIGIQQTAFAQQEVPKAGESRSQLRVDRCDDPSANQSTVRGRAQASQLYDRGLVLYEEGDYEGAIDAFVASYCAKPHPASFYNIAQSYERLLKFELSVVYFERYVAGSDPTAPNTKKATLRAEVLRILPAQIRVATVPAGAAITIYNDTGLRARGKANQEAPLEVVQGRYTMRVTMPGYEDITRSIETKPGQPYSYYLRLEAQSGSLQISATPGNARVFLDDRLVGVGSYSDSLPVGRYEITVEAPNREPSKEVVNVKAGELSEASIELPAPAKSGRRVLLFAAPLAVGITGAVAMDNIFGQSSKVTGAGFAAATGLGFGAAYYGIPESTTRGDAWFVVESSMIGLLEGALLGSFFACDNDGVVQAGEADGCNDDETKAVTAAALAGGLLGIAGAALTHKRFKLSGGDAAVIGSAAIWGLSSSALLYAVFDSDTRIRDPILFSGLNFGLVAGAGILATTDISLERMALIDLGGVGGVIGGALLPRAFQSGDEQLQHFAILGMVSGLVAATIFTRDMDTPGAQTKGGLTSSFNTAPTLTPIVGATTDAAGSQIPNFGFSLRL